jgi:hypothetical protein
MYFRTKLPFLLIIQRVQNADIGISRHSVDNRQKKEHLMKIGIALLKEADNRNSKSVRLTAHRHSIMPIFRLSLPICR